MEASLTFFLLVVLTFDVCVVVENPFSSRIIGGYLTLALLAAYSLRQGRGCACAACRTGFVATKF